MIRPYLSFSRVHCGSFCISVSSLTPWSARWLKLRSSSLSLQWSDLRAEAREAHPSLVTLQNDSLQISGNWHFRCVVDAFYQQQFLLITHDPFDYSFIRLSLWIIIKLTSVFSNHSVDLSGNHRTPWCLSPTGRCSLNPASSAGKVQSSVLRPMSYSLSQWVCCDWDWMTMTEINLFATLFKIFEDFYMSKTQLFH